MGEIRKRESTAVAAVEPAEGGPELRVTVLTVSILALIGILLVFTGYQATEAERTFFREVALNANQEIATLVGRQFAQTFTNCTGLLQDMAKFPAAYGKDLGMVDELFGVLLKRHDIYRALYMVDPDMKVIRARVNINVAKYRPLDEARFALLKKKEVSSVISDFYKSEEDPAITFACSVLDKQETFHGAVVAELNLNFIQDIMSGVRIGRTGEIVLADASGSVIFSSPGFAGLSEFKHFDTAKAFSKSRGSREYGAKVKRLASYQRIRPLTERVFGTPGNQPFFPPVTPDTIPDWLVVVQQNADEAYLVADRMKYNLIVLVIVGVIGLMVIARLWLDSL